MIFNYHVPAHFLPSALTFSNLAATPVCLSVNPLQCDLHLRLRAINSIYRRSARDLINWSIFTPFRRDSCSRDWPNLRNWGSDYEWIPHLWSHWPWQIFSNIFHFFFLTNWASSDLNCRHALLCLSVNFMFLTHRPCIKEGERRQSNILPLRVLINRTRARFIKK